MTTTEAPSGVTEPIDAARDAVEEIADATRSRVDQIRGALEGAVEHVPEVIEGARTGAEQTAGKLQALPAANLRLLAAASVGLAAGLHLAGAPRLVTLAAIAPALLAGGAMATRPVAVPGGAR